MKLTVYSEGVFISVKITNGVDKDGRPTVNKYIALENNGEVGNLRCTSGVFSEIQNAKKYSEMTFQGVIDTWNKDVVITGYKLKSEVK